MTEPDVSRHPLVRRVAEALRRRCGVREGDAIVVAVSGGADSVALLRALTVLAPRRTWGLQLTVAHVQHHLRETAEDDATFVADLAREHGLPFHRRDIHPADADGNLEAAARRLRYAALAEAAEACESGCIATAHHGDDQLETLLMRMIRGTSVQGMRGMPWRRRLDAQTALIRPMLGATHNLATDLCQALGQSWREDPTNADRSRTRARLREQVLPVLHELRPDAAAKAQRLAEHCQQTARLIGRHASAWDSAMRPDTFGYRIDRAVLRAVDADVAAQIVHRLLERSALSPGDVTSDLVEKLTRAGRDREGRERYFSLGSLVTGVNRRWVFAGPPIM